MVTSIRRLKQAECLCTCIYLVKITFCVYTESHLWCRNEVKCKDFMSVCPAGGIYLVQRWTTMDLCLCLSHVGCLWAFAHTGEECLKCVVVMETQGRDRGCGTDRVVTGWRRPILMRVSLCVEITTDGGWKQLALSYWANSLNSDRAANRSVQRDGRAGDIHSALAVCRAILPIDGSIIQAKLGGHQQSCFLCFQISCSEFWVKVVQGN